VHDTILRLEPHQLHRAAKRREPEAATEDLAQHGDVRGHPEKRLGATRGDTEPGHHLVEDHEPAGISHGAHERLEVGGVGLQQAG
jgi:hypothetical protein